MPHKPVGTGTMVYLHRRKTDGVVFYIGIGVMDRPWRKKGRTLWWRNIVAKHGYDVEIIAHSLTDTEAKEMEISLITEYRADPSNALVNLTAGGDGATYIGERGEEIKREIGVRMRETMKGEKWKTNHAAAMKRKFDDPEIAKTHTERMKKITSSDEWYSAMKAGCAKRDELWRENIRKAQSSPEARQRKAMANRKMSVVVSYADRAKRPYTALVGYPWL